MVGVLTNHSNHNIDKLWSDIEDVSQEIVHEALLQRRVIDGTGRYNLD